MSQPELARRINGVAGRDICSQQSIQQLEVGRTHQPRYVIELAQALGVSVNWLRGEVISLDPDAVGTRAQVEAASGHGDDELYRMAVFEVVSFLDATRRKLSTDKKVELVMTVLDILREQGGIKGETLERLVRLAS